ncbi:unnamed protein product [Musa banksii]
MNNIIYSFGFCSTKIVEAFRLYYYSISLRLYYHFSDANLKLSICHTWIKNILL